MFLCLCDVLFRSASGLSPAVFRRPYFPLFCKFSLKAVEIALCRKFDIYLVDCTFGDWHHLDRQWIVK